jgi:hypothetical protein
MIKEFHFVAALAKTFCQAARLPVGSIVDALVKRENSDPFA